MPKITIIKIIHFTIDFLLAGFYMNDAKALGALLCQVAHYVWNYVHDYAAKTL